jgi:hypothetical protein
MTQPLISCCTCQYARADLQRKYNLKKCAAFGDSCNMWKKKETEK